VHRESAHFFLGSSADSLRNDGANGTHVDKDAARTRTFEYSAWPEGSLFHFGAIGQHGDDDVGAARDIGAGKAAFDAIADHRIDQCRNNVIRNQIVAALAEVAHHMPAHNPESNESNLRHMILL